MERSLSPREISQLKIDLTRQSIGLSPNRSRISERAFEEKADFFSPFDIAYTEKNELLPSENPDLNENN